MGKSDLVQKVGGPIHCWSRGPKSWGDRSPWWLRLCLADEVEILRNGLVLIKW
jgi:hypothetical protein